MSLFNEAELRDIIREEVRTAVRLELGKLNEYKAGRVRRAKRTELEAFLAAGPTSDTRADASPEDLADRRFYER